MVLTETPSRPLAPVERAVLLTLAYSDVFDFPLTPAELERYLPVACARSALDDAIDALDSSHLVRRGGFLCLRGRDELVETRRRRAAASAARWHAAERFASWLTRVPFLGMAAVCGSLAVDNAGAEGDVDLFLVTAPRRLWLVQSITMVLRRLGRLRLGIEICPNYLMTRDRLEIEDHNLYVAREIAQAVPLWGEDDYERFLAANRWISEFLPRVGLGDRRRAVRRPDRPRATRLLEGILGGRAGDLLDRAIHRTLLLYYRLRLKSRGFSKDDIERAYLPDRQSLVSGGYAGAVARQFCERAREVLGGAGEDVEDGEVWSRFFGAGDSAVESELRSEPHFAGLFASRYGGSGE